MSTEVSSRPVRVLHVCTILLTGRVFIAPVAQFLSSRGYDVSIACAMTDAPDGPATTEAGDVGGVPVHHVAIPRAIRPIQDLRAVWRLSRLIRRLKPTIVHTQTSKAGVVGRLAARLAGTPIVIHTAHAFPFHPYLPFALLHLYVLIERFAARLADLVMVDTESVRADGLRYRVVRDQTKMVTVPMGIDLKKFSPCLQARGHLRERLGFGSQDLVVGTVARLVADKGLECFLRMAALIRTKRSDVRFLVVGEGPLRPRLERLSESLGLQEAVLFTGHRTDVPTLMQTMDLFVLPTRREGFGVVFAEAMAMGIPALGSRIGPVAEVVDDGVTGYLLPPDDPDQFAVRAMDLLNDETKRRAFGEAGRDRVEARFSETRMCETIEQHYQRLLKLKGLSA